jgi:hypothetical protein
VTTNSGTGGYLTPTAGAAVYDDALDDLLQTVFVGLTGLPGANVRPRYQAKPPKQRAGTVDWCAVGVMVLDKDAAPAIASQDDGSATLQRHEDIHVLASFYGPNAGALASQAADGLALVQNNEVLMSQLMTYVNNDTIRQVPELVGEQWIRRMDLPVHFRRQVKRAYAVQSLASADSILNK